MHYYWVAYDIRHNRTRRLVAKWCKQAGLLRIQRSVFAGRSSPDRIREMEEQASGLLAPHDRLGIVPLDRTAWQNLLLLGDNPGKAALSRNEPVRYF
ncbi:MAG: CRISPR-associated endonuclease Cas2 [Saprospiraceae bacterium]